MIEEIKNWNKLIKDIYFLKRFIVCRIGPLRLL